MGSAVRVVRRRRRVIFIVTAVCVLLAVLVALVLRPHYKSLAEIEVEQDEENPLQTSLGAVAATGGIPDDVKTQIQTEATVLQGDDLALATIDQTNYEAHLNESRIPQEKGLPLAQAPEARKDLLQRFSRHLTILPIEGTRLIQVGFTDTDPNFAATTATTLINLYIHQRLLRKNSSTAQATEWIGAQISDVNKKLEASQQALMDYQRKSGLLSLPSAGQTGAPTAAGTGVRSPAVDRLVQLNQSLVAAETDRISKEAIYRVIVSGDQTALANVAGSQLANNAVQDPTQAAMFTGLINLRQQQGAVDIQLANARQNYGAKNPHLIELNRQSDELKRQIRDEVKAIVDRASLDYRTALKNETGLKDAYTAELNKTDDANAKQVHLASLQQEADSNRALYEDLYTKLEQSRLAVGTQAANIAIVSKALPPSDPAYPRPFLYALVGLLAGLLLGVLAAFIVDGSDDSVAIPADIEHLTGLPVLASIPLTKGPGGSGAPASWVPNEPQSLNAEAFRDLRTNLISIRGNSLAKTLLVSSPLPSEGRTSTVYNLGASFASIGQSVLIIDSDLRKPALNQFANSDKVRGLSSWLTSPDSLQGLAIPASSVPGLSILTAGSAVKNPAELLGSSRFDELLARCRESYDWILLDSPASMIVADAAILSKKVDGVLLLAKAGSTSRLAVQRAVQQLERNQAHTLGVALNAVNTSSSEYYYANGFHGYSGKGYYGYEKT